MADSVRDRLRAVLVDALELSADTAVESVRHRAHPRWDSLGHLALVGAIEDEFEVELDSDQLLSIDSFDAALAILKELGIAD